MAEVKTLRDREKGEKTGKIQICAADTVEHHLTHAYQKLGINSRIQLEKVLTPSSR
jgi:DNA-binding CsgD family transcriptional regulator